MSVSKCDLGLLRVSGNVPKRHLGLLRMTVSMSICDFDSLECQ